MSETKKAIKKAPKAKKKAAKKKIGAKKLTGWNLDVMSIARRRYDEDGPKAHTNYSMESQKAAARKMIAAGLLEEVGREKWGGVSVVLARLTRKGVAATNHISYVVEQRRKKRKASKKAVKQFAKKSAKKVASAARAKHRAREASEVEVTYKGGGDGKKKRARTRESASAWGDRKGLDQSQLKMLFG